MNPTARSATDRLPKPEVLLFDLDGTLYRGKERIEGADRLISNLIKKGIPFLYVTNNSTRTPSEVADHLREMEIPADESAIVTSATAAAYYVQSRYPGAGTYVIGERGLRVALTDAGMRLAEDDDAADVQVSLVVQGLDRELTYDRLATATRHLLNGAAFVQTNPDRLLPVDGGFLPGAGSIGASLQAASGIEPIPIGKPSSVIMDYSLKLAGAEPAKAWVIGDNPYTDLAAARNSGCLAVLVLTGLCTEQNWRKHCEAAGVMPDAICKDLEELEQLLNNQIE